MKKITLTLLSALLLTQSYATEITHDNSQDWYALPAISHIKADRSRGTGTDEHGTNYSFDIGKKINDNINLELGYNRNLIEVFESDLKQNGLELDALYFLNRNASFAPFVVAGAGMVKTSALDDTNPTWGGGVGFLSDLGLMKNAKLRAEARFQQEVDSSEWTHDDVLLRAGLQIPFGATAAAPAVVAPKDSDGDGVNDDADKCPATPAGIAVNSYGCELDSDGDGVVDSKDNCPNTPAGTAVNASGCAVVLDSDNDGVNDNADKCPNTPAGTAVNASGCPVDPDDDNDGVPNSKDQCPNSAAGVKIDFKGCEIKAVITLPGINFETNSAKLTANSLSILNGAADTLNKYPEINALVAGHTDSTGADAYNMSLSERRAASVLNYLVSKGVSASRLTSQGFGETQPIADNKTATGRAANRRVNLRVQD